MAQLQREGMGINRKTVARYMREMGIAAIYPGPNLSRRNQQEQVYPYLLRHLICSYSNQVWGIDITSIRMHAGWMYLVAILDWYSRSVVSWELDQTLEFPFVLTAHQRWNWAIFGVHEGRRSADRFDRSICRTVLVPSFTRTTGYYTHTINQPSLVDQLEGAGLTWKGYFQSMPSPGFEGICYPVKCEGAPDISALYAAKHNGFPYFAHVQKNPKERRKIVPLTQLGQDLQNSQLPNFSFIVPDQYHDRRPA